MCLPVGVVHSVLLSLLLYCIVRGQSCRSWVWHCVKGTMGTAQKQAHSAHGLLLMVLHLLLLSL